MIYSTLEFYLEYSGKNSEDVCNALRSASRHIDTLTFNRIRWEELSDFQREIVQEVCCDIADFELDNAEMLNSVVSGYSINGVSMQFGGNNVRQIDGVTVKNDIYQKLCQTGLCYRGL